MKNLVLLGCAASLLTCAATAQKADQAKKHEPRPEMKALLEKYNTNKDGKLDREEGDEISEADW